MKKIISTFLMVILLSSFTACSEAEIDQNASKEIKEEVIQTNEENKIEEQTNAPLVVDNISITIKDYKIGPVQGDRNKDNYDKENGEYFALTNGDIAKADDYEKIEIEAIIENKSAKAINFSDAGWEAKLPDGFKLNNIIIEGKAKEQIPSNYKGEGKLTVFKEKGLKVNTLLLTYYLMDYNEEWQKDIWKAISGELTEVEYKSKYNPKPMEFKLKLE